MQKKYPINCHTHIFSLSVIPENILGRGAAFGLNFLKRGEKDFVIGLLRNTLLKILGRATSRRLGAIADSVVAHNDQKAVLCNLIKFYSELEYPDMKFVVLCQDMDHTGIKSYNYMDAIHQMYEVAQIMEDEFFRDRILPFVAVDPRSFNEPIHIVRKFVNDCGFKGIKLYPTVGFFGDDERLMPVYEYASKHQLPILVHYTGGVIYYRGNLPYRKDKSVFRFRKGKDYQLNFLNPHYFRNVLKKYPNLKICFAHFAGTMDDSTIANLDSYQLDPYEYFDNRKWGDSTPDEQEIRAYMHKYIVKLINDDEYPNVFTDIAFEFSRATFVDKVNEYMGDNNSPRLRERILFGTDFFVNSKNDGNKDEFGLVTKLATRLDETTLNQMMFENNNDFLQSDFYPET